MDTSITYRVNGTDWTCNRRFGVYTRVDGDWHIDVECLSAQQIVVAYFHHESKGMCGEMVIARNVVWPAKNAEVIAILNNANLAYDGFAAAVDLVFPDPFRVRKEKHDLASAASKVVKYSSQYRNMPPMLAAAIQRLAVLVGKGSAA